MKFGIDPTEIDRRVSVIHGDTLKITSYLGMNVTTQFVCHKHGEFQAKPANVIHNRSGCPSCWKERRVGIHRKQPATYVQELTDRYGDKISALEPYQKALTKILHQCSKGHVWNSRPNDVLNGYGCPTCDVSTYRRRTFTVKGRSFTLQGREIHALVELAEEFPLDEIQVQGLRIPYRENGRNRFYVPDFRVGNLIVEVKSPHSAGKYDEEMFENLKRKRTASLEVGFVFELRVYDGAGRRVAIPCDWHEMNHAEFGHTVKDCHGIQ